MCVCVGILCSFFFRTSAAFKGKTLRLFLRPFALPDQIHELIRMISTTGARGSRDDFFRFTVKEIVDEAAGLAPEEKRALHAQRLETLGKQIYHRDPLGDLSGALEALREAEALWGDEPGGARVAAFIDNISHYKDIRANPEHLGRLVESVLAGIRSEGSRIPPNFLQRFEGISPHDIDPPLLGRVAAALCETVVERPLEEDRARLLAMLARIASALDARAQGITLGAMAEWWNEAESTAEQEAMVRVYAAVALGSNHAVPRNQAQDLLHAVAVNEATDAGVRNLAVESFRAASAAPTRCVCYSLRFM